MERMVAVDKDINVVSGHMGGGKTMWFKFLTGLPENQGPDTLAFTRDDLVVKYFGKRAEGTSPEDNSQARLLAIYNKMTNQERLYIDEILRVDTERAIIVEDKKRVIFDAGMSSRELHQKPFKAMVEKVQALIGVIDTERAAKQGLLPPDPASKINLRVVILYCDFETVRRRMAERWPHLSSNELPPPIIETLPKYPMPIDYPFLAINTSDESPDAHNKRKQEIMDFFAGRITDSDLIAARAQEAKQCLEAHKREIQKFLK